MEDLDDQVKQRLCFGRCLAQDNAITCKGSPVSAVSEDKALDRQLEDTGSYNGRRASLSQSAGGTCPPREDRRQEGFAPSRDARSLQP